MTSGSGLNQWLPKAGVAVFIAASVLVGIAIASSVIRSRSLLLRDVEVLGTTHLPREEVLEFTGLDRPRSALEVDARVLEEVLRQHTWVEGVQVDRPSRDGLHIRIQEAVPRAVITAPELMLVTAEGRVIDRVDALPTDLPLMTGVVRPRSGDSVSPESWIPPAPEQIEAEGWVVDGPVVASAIEVVDAWRATVSGAMNPIVEMGWSSVTGLTVWLASGVEVKLGDHEMAQRMRRVEQVLEEASVRDRRLVRIDARGGRTMTLRYASDEKGSDQP